MQIDFSQFSSLNELFPLQAELINDNLFEWHVKLHRIDPDSSLATDMNELNVPYVLLHMSFPDNFPFAPPFLRVVEPKIEKGFVMEGGAICMELLTPRGNLLKFELFIIVMEFLIQGGHQLTPSKQFSCNSQQVLSKVKREFVERRKIQRNLQKNMRRMLLDLL